MPATKPANFAWNNFKPYRAFDGLLTSLIIEGKSYLTTDNRALDLESGLREIKEVFVDGFDDGASNYEEKLAVQFADTSENTRLVFNHLEYLWAMPARNIGAAKKRAYVRRWFSEAEVKDEESLFFGGGQECIANPGQHYLTNKYYELRSVATLMEDIMAQNKKWDVLSLKKFCENYCYDKLHLNSPKKYCGIYPAILHLTDPDAYLSIISREHRRLIPAVFAHIIPDAEKDECPEKHLLQIRESLYNDHGHSTDEVWKYRWFFYCEDVVSIWKNKKIRTTSKKALQEASIDDEIQRELGYEKLSVKEGERVETVGYKIQRDQKIVTEAKKRDKYTCQACSFSFKQRIVHVHHLDPISERKTPRETVSEDLITLCPNCHYIAHYYLRQKNGNDYKSRERLLKKLKELNVR